MSVPWSVAVSHSSRRSIISQRHEEDQENTFLTKKLNLRYNGQIYFRNTVHSRYRGLPRFSESCKRISPEGLLHIQGIRHDFPGFMPRVSVHPNVCDALARISDNCRVKQKKTSDAESTADSIKSFDTAKSERLPKINSVTDDLKRTPDDFIAQLTQDIQDPIQLQYIKRCGEDMQKEVPLPILTIVYKEVQPILNAIHQDYKKIFSQRKEHFMTEDARNQAAQINSYLENLQPQ